MISGFNFDWSLNLKTVILEKHFKFILNLNIT